MKLCVIISQDTSFIYTHDNLEFYPQIVCKTQAFKACSQNCEKRLLAPSCPSARLTPCVCPHRKIGLQSFMKCDIWVFFENLSRKYNFNWNLSRIAGIVLEDLYTFLIMSRSVLLEMRKVSYKSCRENQNTHFKSKTIFFFANRAFYEIMWKHFLDPDRPRLTIWRMLFGCWIPKPANILSAYVIIAFPPQQWLHEHDSRLRYTYIVCLVWI